MPRLGRGLRRASARASAVVCRRHIPAARRRQPGPRGLPGGLAVRGSASLPPLRRLGFCLGGWTPRRLLAEWPRGRRAQLRGDVADAAPAKARDEREHPLWGRRAESAPKVQRLGGGRQPRGAGKGAVGYLRAGAGRGGGVVSWDGFAPSAWGSHTLTPSRAWPQVPGLPLRLCACASSGAGGLHPSDPNSHPGQTGTGCPGDLPPRCAPAVRSHRPASPRVRPVSRLPAPPFPPPPPPNKQTFFLITKERGADLRG